jgi:hypothetical protein
LDRIASGEAVDSVMKSICIETGPASKKHVKEGMPKVASKSKVKEKTPKAGKVEVEVDATSLDGATQDNTSQPKQKQVKKRFGGSKKKGTDGSALRSSSAADGGIIIGVEEKS